MQEYQIHEIADIPETGFIYKYKRQEIWKTRDRKYTGTSDAGNMHEYQRQKIDKKYTEIPDARNIQECQKQEIHRNISERHYTGTGNIQEYKIKEIYRNTR